MTSQLACFLLLPYNATDLLGDVIKWSRVLKLMNKTCHALFVFLGNGENAGHFHSQKPHCACLFSHFNSRDRLRVRFAHEQFFAHKNRSALNIFTFRLRNTKRFPWIYIKLCQLSSVKLLCPSSKETFNMTYFSTVWSTWSERACPANQHPKSTIKKKRILNYLSLHDLRFLLC